MPALADLNKAITLNPGFTDAYLNRSISKANLGDLAGALKDYNKAIELNPNLEVAYCNRAHLKAQNDKSGALADYSRALEINPTSESAYANRGNLKTEMGDLDGALADLNRTIELHPRTINANKGPFLTMAYIERGSVKQQQKDYDGALADFNKAIELDPASISAYYHRCLLEKFQGNLEATLEDTRKVLELRSNFSGPITSETDMPKGGWQKALSDFNKTSEVKHQTVITYLDRGRVEQMKGDLSGALVDFSNAMTLAP